VAVAEDIYDEQKGRYQSDINKEADDNFVLLENRIGNGDIKLYQGGISSEGVEDDSQYWLRSGLLSNFYLEVNSGYYAAYIAKYNADGSFMELQSNGDNPINITDTTYLYKVVFFKGSMPGKNVIHPSEVDNIVSEFKGGIYATLNNITSGDENNKQSAQYAAKQVMTKLADNEDLTVEGIGVEQTLRLADRDTSKGMGYVILRINKSFAEQVTEPNTIYEIRYNFILKDAEGNSISVSIPENCVLKFNGGSVEGGDITFNNTTIKGRQDLFRNSICTGPIANTDIYDDWFTADEYKTSHLEMLFKCMTKGIHHNLYLSNRKYHIIRFKIEKKEDDNFELTIIGNNSTIVVDGGTEEKPMHRNDWPEVFRIANAKYIEFRNVNFSGEDSKSVGELRDFAKQELIGKEGYEEAYLDEVIAGSKTDDYVKKKLYLYGGNEMYAANLINFRNIKKAIVDNCIFAEMSYHGGILAANDNEYVVVRNCRFTDYDTAIVGSEDENSNKKCYLYVQNNVFDGDYTVSEPINCTYKNEIHAWIENNFMANKRLASGIDFEARAEGSTLYITNNEIINCDAGFYLKGANLKAFIQNNIIKDMVHCSYTIAKLSADNPGMVDAYFNGNYFGYAPSPDYNLVEDAKLTFVNNTFETFKLKNSDGDGVMYKTNVSLINNNIKSKITNEETINSYISSLSSLVIKNNTIERMVIRLQNQIKSNLQISDNIGDVVFNFPDYVDYIDADSNIKLQKIKADSWANCHFRENVVLEISNVISYKPYNLKDAIIELLVIWKGDTKYSIFRSDSNVFGAPKIQINKGDIVYVKLKSLGKQIYQVLEYYKKDNPLIRLKDGSSVDYMDLLNGDVAAENVYGFELKDDNLHYLMAFDFSVGPWSSVANSIADLKKTQEEALNDYDVARANGILYDVDQTSMELYSYNYCKEYVVGNEEKGTWMVPTLPYVNHFSKYITLYNVIRSFLGKTDKMTDKSIYSTAQSTTENQWGVQVDGSYNVSEIYKKNAGLTIPMKKL